MLMNQQYGTSKKRKRKSTNLYIRLLQKVLKVTFIAHDEATGKKIEKWLHL
jgi:hypothetical protein